MKNLKIMVVAVTLFTITQASDYTDLQLPQVASEKERAIWINNFFNPISGYVRDGYKAFQDSYTQGVERQDGSESQGLSPEEAAIFATDIMNQSTEVATKIVKTASSAYKRAVSLVTGKSDVQVAPVVEAPVVEAPVVQAPVAQSTLDLVKSSAVNAFNSAITKTQSAANTTASYAKVPFVKANEFCNTLNGKMFTVVAEDNSYSAMLKNNATQITAGTLVTAAVVYGAYTYFNKPVSKSAKK
jgi:hypothetical protein